MNTTWRTLRTSGYSGVYDHGPDYDRRACGGVVHIQERLFRGRYQLRAWTSNGRYGFGTQIADRPATRDELARIGRLGAPAMAPTTTAGQEDLYVDEPGRDSGDGPEGGVDLPGGPGPRMPLDF